ncbi:IclR family transcriptional regulator [Dactylosporangium roseum]|uniref:IclR family transcriptional regulator n=1 Tax=Dactylosporangium roseum TaxID=47989 RepID=A0ABY5ZDP7_9ACTN|nr:IclR family transcriptional regulator [Dactylosporangium roseum]UWZ39706.1 IclR family transcriptional regulator [Dactylosporangium roseum]
MDAILSAFTPQRPTMSLSELSRRSGVPKGTAHRLTGQLVAMRLLEHSSDGGLCVGLRFFELGTLWHVAQSVRDASRAHAVHLRNNTRQTVHVGVLDGDQVLYIDKHIGVPLQARLPSKVGARIPAHATALGKALAAFREDWRPAAELPRLTSQTTVLHRQLERELDQIRATQISFDRQESSPGIVCVASPILDFGGAAVASISISGELGVMDPEAHAGAVLTAARAIGMRLQDGLKAS